MNRSFFLPLLLPLLAPAPTVARPSGAEEVDAACICAVCVAGTTWAGKDSDGQYYEYHFQPGEEADRAGFAYGLPAGGPLHYKSPSGFWKNANWMQDGDSIYFEFNDKYCEQRGRIFGTRMRGSAWNVTGKKWTWQVEKK